MSVYFHNVRVSARPVGTFTISGVGHLSRSSFFVSVLMVGALLLACGANAPTTQSQPTSDFVPSADVPGGAVTRVDTLAGVGHTAMMIIDPTRPGMWRTGNTEARQYTVEVRYPTDASGRLTAGVHPVIMFAHGYNTSTWAYAVLLDGLARAGSIVVAPEFPGESTVYAGEVVRDDRRQEPCDLVRAWEALHDTPPAPLTREHLGGLVYMGHSDGALAVADGAFASACEAPVAAVVALSGGAPGAYLRSLPVLAVVGTNDEVNPPWYTQALYESAPGLAWLVTIANADHSEAFMGDATPPALWQLIDTFVDSATGVGGISLDLAVVGAQASDERLAVYGPETRRGPFHASAFTANSNSSGSDGSGSESSGFEGPG